MMRYDEEFGWYDDELVEDDGRLTKDVIEEAKKKNKELKELSLKEKYDILLGKRKELMRLSEEFDISGMRGYSNTIICFLKKEELYKVAEALEIENVSFNKFKENSKSFGEWFFEYMGFRFYYLVGKKEDL